MDFQKISNFLDSLQSEGIPSVDCMICKDREQIYRHMNGHTDAAGTKAIHGNELYMVYSMTKIQTMVAIMQLIEQGKVSLEDEVSKYLPAYQNLTVKTIEGPVPIRHLKMKHLVSMQSGLDYDLSRPGIMHVLREKGRKASTREIVDAFVETPLDFVPGEHFQYSLSHDVVAAVIEVVTEMRFSEYMKKNIWEPLHMEHTCFAKQRNEEENMVTQFLYHMEQHTSSPMEPTCEYQLSDNYESGGAGLISCTMDYAVLADTLACGGTSKEGVHILDADTIDLMRTNMLGEQSRSDIANTMGRVGYGYGCGVQVLLDPTKIHSNAPTGIFGWDGAAGSCVIMDRERRLSLVYMQHVRNCGYAYGVIHPTLRELLYEHISAINT